MKETTYQHLHCVSKKGYHPTNNDNFNNSCPDSSNFWHKYCWVNRPSKSSLIYHLTSVYCTCLTLGNFKILKLKNLALNCRLTLWFPSLYRKWVWMSRSLSSLEWKSMASITAMSYSLSRGCQRSSTLQAIRLSFNKTMLHLIMQGHH